MEVANCGQSIGEFRQGLGKASKAWPRQMRFACGPALNSSPQAKILDLIERTIETLERLILEVEKSMEKLSLLEGPTWRVWGMGYVKHLILKGCFVV